MRAELSGPHRRRALSAAHRLAGAPRGCGRTEEAEVRYRACLDRACLEAYRSSFGDSDDHTVAVMRNLARLLEERDRDDEAAVLRADVLAVGVGADDTEAIAEMARARVLATDGDARSALAALRRARRAVVQRSGAGASSLRRLDRALAAAFREDGAFASAARVELRPLCTDRRTGRHWRLSDARRLGTIVTDRMSAGRPSTARRDVRRFLRGCDEPLLSGAAASVARRVAALAGLEVASRGPIRAGGPARNARR